MRKIDQQNSRHRACHRRGGLGARYVSDTGRFRKMVSQTGMTCSAATDTIATAVQTVVDESINAIQQVAAIIKRGSNYKSLAGRLAKMLGLNAEQRIQAGLQARIR
jgi:hypothetical protein